MSKEVEQFGQKGIIFSFTEIERDHAPTKSQPYTPYPLAIIELENGRKITAQLTDLDPQGSVEIGMK